MSRQDFDDWPPSYAYRVLGESVPPDASLEQVKNAGFRGRMTPQEREAWDALRRTSRRLIVDFFLFRRPLAGRPE